MININTPVHKTSLILVATLLFLIGLSVWIFIVRPKVKPTQPHTLPKATTTLTTQPIQQWTTHNGVSVFFNEAALLPIIDINLVWNAGSAYTQQKPGLAAITNAMLAEGTQTRSANELNETLESLGAIYGNATGREMGSVSLRSLATPSYFDPSLAVLIDIAAHPSFPEDSFLRIQNEMLQNLKLIDQTPGAITERVFYETIYKNHPYAEPVEGTFESVSHFKIQDLKAFYQTHYAAQNAMIVIVGQLDRAHAEHIAEQIAQALPQGQRVTEIPQPQPIDNPSFQHIVFPSQQTHITLGAPALARLDPDYFPLIVGNHILGGSSMNSQLFQVVRIQNGLAYSIDSGFSPMRNPGPFSIDLQTRTEKTEEALTLIRQTLKKFLEEGPSETELEAAKQNLMGSFPLKIASNGSQLALLTGIGFYHLPLDYPLTYQKNIEQVTLAQIKEAFKRHVDPDRMALVTVGATPNMPATPSSG
jgi:zinc protease